MVAPTERGGEQGVQLRTQIRELVGDCEQTRHQEVRHCRPRELLEKVKELIVEIETFVRLKPG